MPFPPTVARALTRMMLSEEEIQRYQELHYQDAGHGYDAFGMHPDFVRMGAGITRPLYERYFRVRSSGHEHIPSEGPVLLAANHSGTIPLDGMMLWADVLRHSGRPLRAIADHFVPTLPWLGVLFARGGMVGGSRGNVRALLEAGEALMIFPEGVPGIGKSFQQRYQLQKWRVGHAELAMRHRTPIVPVAIIGAEEQMPQIARININLGFIPYIPIPLTPLPLPVRYHIHYGPPIPIDQDYHPAQADDPVCVAEAAQRVQEGVEALIARGLEERGGRIFR